MRSHLICRTCMVKHVPVPMGQAFVNIFDESEHNKYLSDMLSDCASIKVEKNDGLPQYICSNCKEKLTSAWNFRVMAIESLAKMRNPYIDMDKAVLKSVAVIEEELVQQEISDIKMEEIDLPMNHNRCEIESDEKLITVEEFQVQYPDTKEKVLEDPLKDRGSTCCESDEFFESSALQHSESELSDSVEDEVITSEGESNENLDVIMDMIDEENVCITNGNQKMMRLSEARKLSRRKRRELHARCMQCNKLFPWTYYWEVHVYHHSGMEHFKCKECGQGFLWQFQLDIHERVHTDERPYFCEICGNTFKCLSTLNSHRLVHREKRPHKCDKCEKSFKHIFLLTAHEETHKKDKFHTIDDVQDKFLCDLCGNSYSGGLSAFGTHKNTHDVSSAAGETKVYPCPTCGRTYRSRSRMRTHLKEHTEQRKYRCQQCNQMFRTKRDRDRHMLRHTGDKPHRCSVCDKAFRHLGTIHNHMRVHTGETPFHCDLCPLQFMFSTQLKTHMKYHDDVRSRPVI